MKKYYIIYENPSEHTSSVPVYIGETLPDAEAHIMEFADWYCPQGTVSIKVVDEYFRQLERRKYYDGKLVEVIPQRVNLVSKR